VPLAYVDGAGRRGVVPLSAVARIIPADAPQQIERVEQLRAVRFTVIPPPEVPLQSAMEQVQGLVAGLRQEGRISPQVDVVPAGTASKLAEVREAMMGEWHGMGSWNQLIESFKSLLFSRLFLALVITYLLMAALFESFLYPFVILFTVPLATVGGFLGLRIMHTINPSQQLDVLTMLGFVILIGIVVNNAILIVHQSLNFMRGLGETGLDQTERLPMRRAVRQAVYTRFRPVFMTMLTSCFGMMPLVVMPGSGSELYRGLGSVIIGGLIVSSVFTLLVVPMVFTLVLDVKVWL
jgi:HAE1 family hydrophobic/amphiphilic exporter-1